MFHRNSGAPPQTLPNAKYDAPREVCGDRKWFYDPLKKWGLEQICDVNSSWVLKLCQLNSGRFHLLPLDVSYIKKMVCHDSTYVSFYLVIVQLCVKSQVDYYPREAGTTEQRFSFYKTKLSLGTCLCFK